MNELGLIVLAQIAGSREAGGLNRPAPGPKGCVLWEYKVICL